MKEVARTKQKKEAEAKKAKDDELKRKQTYPIISDIFNTKKLSLADNKDLELWTNKVITEVIQLHKDAGTYESKLLSGHIIYKGAECNTNIVTPQVQTVVQRANKKRKQEELEVRRNAAVAKITPNMYDVHDINAILSAYPDAIKYELLQCYPRC